MKDEFNSQIVSLIRTVVPVVVGQLLTWLATKGVLDETGEISAALVSLFTVVFTSAYYALARLLEVFVSTKFGWMLGIAKAPTYRS